MITRDKLAEQILEYIKFNRDRDQDEEVDIREVRLYMDEVANGFAKNGRLESMREGDDSMPSCYLTVFKDVPVKKNEAERYCYIDIPSKYINISHGRGIVIYDQTQGRRKILIQMRSMGLLENSAAGKLEGRLGYMVEGSRAIFNREVTKGDYQLDSVTVVLAVVSAADLPDDVEYPIDYGILTEFIEVVSARFIKQTLATKEK